MHEEMIPRELERRLPQLRERLEATHGPALATWLETSRFPAARWHLAEADLPVVVAALHLFLHELTATGALTVESAGPGERWLPLPESLDDLAGEMAAAVRNLLMTGASAQAGVRDCIAAATGGDEQADEAERGEAVTFIYNLARLEGQPLGLAALFALRYCPDDLFTTLFCAFGEGGIHPLWREAADLLPPELAGHLPPAAPPGEHDHDTPTVG